MPTREMKEGGSALLENQATHDTLESEHGEGQSEGPKGSTARLKSSTLFNHRIPHLVGCYLEEMEI